MGENARYLDDPFQVYLSEIQRIPRLDRAEEVDCIAHVRSGDEMAESSRRRLVEGNLLLVVLIAQRYRNHQVHLLDLIQKGNEGLAHAVENLSDCGHDQFLSHATGHIERAVAEAASGSIPVETSK